MNFARSSTVPNRLPNKNIFYYLALGSNLGDRRANIEKAVVFLHTCGRVLKRSSSMRPRRVGMPGAGLFLNMVLALESPLAAAGAAGKMQGARGGPGARPGKLPS